MNNPFFLYSLSQLQEIAYSFKKEISAASDKKITSVSYLIYPLPSKQPNVQSSFQSMIIGGSVFEKAMIKQTEKHIFIDNLEKSHVPQFATKEVFLDFIYSHIDSSTQYVAINFTYPTHPIIHNNIIDGCLIKGTKGHVFHGLIGKNIGTELAEYTKQKSGKTIIFSLANDTICLLLAGIKDINIPIAGGIVGTGVNFGFYNSSSLVNLESGNFNLFPQTETGKQIDIMSNNQGLQLFEKEVSGKYLYEHFNLIAKQQEISMILSSTFELHDLAFSNASVASHIAQALFKRSASLVACQIAGIYQYLNQRNLSIVMEGSVFWTGWNYKLMVEKYLTLLGIPDKAIQFIKIDHSNIIGAAKLITGI